MTNPPDRDAPLNPDEMGTATVPSANPNSATKRGGPWSHGVVLAVADELCRRAISKRLVEISDWAQDRYLEDARALLSGCATPAHVAPKPPPPAGHPRLSQLSQLFPGG